jgi:hypothetical protein
MADVEKEVAPTGGMSAKQQKLFELRMRMVMILSLKYETR